MSQKGSTFALHNIIYLGYSYVCPLLVRVGGFFFALMHFISFICLVYHPTCKMRSKRLKMRMRVCLMRMRTYMRACACGSDFDALRSC